MGIKRMYITVLFLCSIHTWATIHRDSISMNEQWNYWHVEKVSSNGDWGFVYQMHPNDDKKNKVFTVNTDTKRKIEVTGIDLFSFTANNYLIGKKGNETIEINLNDAKQQNSLGKLKQQDWIETEQLMVYTTENKELILRKYSKQGGKDILKLEGVSSYSCNPSKTKLVYQVEGSTIVYLLDLKTRNKKEVLDLKEPLTSITWNFQEDAIGIVLSNKDVGFLELNKDDFKIIPLSKSQESIVMVDVSFLRNNDLYISYWVRKSFENTEDGFLDIWNGNDRELKFKKSGKPQSELRTTIYSQGSEKIIELPTSSKQNYLNIGIPNYVLVYDPLELQDYSQSVESIRYRILQLEPFKELGDLTIMTSFSNLYTKAPIGNAILYAKGNVWEVYDFDTHKRISIPHVHEWPTPMWTADGKEVFYSDGENVIRYNLKTKTTTKITNLKGKNSFQFLNVFPEKNRAYIDLNKPFLFSVYSSDYKMSYRSWFKDKVTELVEEAEYKLGGYYNLKQGISSDGNSAIWTDENYNQPQTVKVFRKGKVSTLLAPEVPEELYNWRKQKLIHYKDKYGVDLTGILWYPKDFNPTKKYPMITWVYERLESEKSRFEIPSLYNQQGFNAILLNEQGYFVFMPDTYVSEEGPGLSALECVTKGIETITVLESAIDKTKLGLAGHSFGGYETSFILGNSKLFAAGMSGGGVHDLISYNYEYNRHKSKPNFFRVEGAQFYLKPFNENPNKYYANSAIHFAHNYITPVLLWTGMEDDNVHWEQTRHMYIALKRYEKPVIALFYEKEGHSISKYKSQKDLTLRFLDWFDYYLKDKKEIEWISNGVDYTKY